MMMTTSYGLCKGESIKFRKIYHKTIKYETCHGYKL